jgi:undecaprenyl-phosphate 4-deoxy-4-formamido-L-arabinose transferase
VPSSSDPAAAYPGLSVVVPAYRSPGTLEELCRELAEHVSPLVASLEVIFVDDGSGDATWNTIETLAVRYPWVRGLTLLRNYGQHNALLAGLRDAQLPLVLTIDDDLQNPPNQVPLLLAALTDDVDLVYAVPTALPHGPLRNAASWGTKRAMAAALGPDVHPRSSAFRLFRRELIDASVQVSDPFVSIDVMLSWATSRIAVVELAFGTRQGGRSGYTFRKLVRHALNMITGYSTRPLRWVSVAGLVFALFGFGLLAFVLVRSILDPTGVPGFTFLAAAVTLFSGVQLFSLGVIGEYVGRMHFRSMGRPPYVVRARTPTCVDRAHAAERVAADRRSEDGRTEG